VPLVLISPRTEAKTFVLLYSAVRRRTR
jgi:hypothetical protein